MKIQISYNSNDVTPNDGYTYDEAALADEFERRFEAFATLRIALRYPDAHIMFSWGSPSLRVAVTAGTDSEAIKAATRIESLLAEDNDVWTGIEWDNFLIAE